MYPGYITLLRVNHETGHVESTKGDTTQLRSCLKLRIVRKRWSARMTKLLWLIGCEWKRKQNQQEFWITNHMSCPHWILKSEWWTWTQLVECPDQIKWTFTLQINKIKKTSCRNGTARISSVLDSDFEYIGYSINDYIKSDFQEEEYDIFWDSLVAW